MKTTHNLMVLGFLCFSLYHPVTGQTRNLYVEGSGDQLGVVHTTSQGSSIAGIELLRGSEFNSTDWRIINRGGTLRIFDGIDNFATDGDENVSISNAGAMTILNGSEASVGTNSGILILGTPSGANLALDDNEILARNGNVPADLFLQPGADVGNTYLNIADGNVGIGTSAVPLGFRLAVGGKTICEEVQVELQNDWPDYVFDQNYQLTPLDQLEQAIDRLGHLPDVPSAENVKQDGIALGAMQGTLLKKIEEITLYLIQLKNENANLQRQIDILKAIKE